VRGLLDRWVTTRLLHYQRTTLTLKRVLTGYVRRRRAHRIANADRLAYLLKLLFHRHRRYDLRLGYDRLCWILWLRPSLRTLILRVKTVIRDHNGALFRQGWAKLAMKPAVTLVPIERPSIPPMTLSKRVGRRLTSIERPKPRALVVSRSPVHLPIFRQKQRAPPVKILRPDGETMDPDDFAVRPTRRPARLTANKVRTMQPMTTLRSAL
jgi:hypothetical protein